MILFDILIRIIYGRINDIAMSNIVNNPSLQKFFLYARKSTDIEDMQVQSIEGQLDELRLLAKRENITIVEELVEKQSAKVPGRPIFNKMLEMIEEGRANGIISWHPDRLARNSVDGGRIIYLVDTEKISALKFNTFWFEPTPQGKFMLSISFSQSKYYVDSLSENTRRGLRQKARNGNFPGVAPRGYLNDTRNRTK
ncbi:MAG: Recombinase [Candidatus Woesebacteria bacterium GW2011_GWA2_33_28]|uniref:Recombinase n=1 Tax=Candidatus Woesebacteria bacterium GW2011_GWA2_33_28 TaxID=1618561 RepID=A0A0G0A9Y2_9BACT|nr:MAG: Recombinase [Candidatus Woesebacteria bacterium GW2011_GWA2_33_28]